MERNSSELGNTDIDRERFLAETRSGKSQRGEFARDRARV